MTSPRCLAPDTCPVPSPDAFDLRRVRTTSWQAATTVWTTYQRVHLPQLFNASGRGHARFSPLATTDAGIPAVLYLARTMTVSLLETAFHDVHTQFPRRISVPIDLAHRGTIQLTTPPELTFIDLRDAALEHLGLRREQLVSTTPAHYACTQDWAQRLVWRHVGQARPVGLLWNSRIAELARADHFLLEDLLHGEPAEVAMVIGSPHTPVTTALPHWQDHGRHLPTLDRGEGRAIVEEIATDYLNATIIDT